MRKTMFVCGALFAVCLACSGGSRRTKSPPNPTAPDSSLREILLRLGKGKCSLTTVSDSHWVLEFKKSSARRIFKVDWVGTDYVRLTEGGVRYDLPLSSIVLIKSDD